MRYSNGIYQSSRATWVSYYVLSEINWDVIKVDLMAMFAPANG